MKKVIVSLVLVLVIAIGGGVYYLFTNLDSIIKSGIEYYGSEVTRTAVRVKSVKTDLSKGSIAIHDLNIANPNGYDLPYAFSLKNISTQIDLNSLQKPPYIINEIVIDNVKVFAEINKHKKTNLYQLKQNLAISGDSTASVKLNSEDIDKSNTSHEPRIIIRRIVFTPGSVLAKVKPLKKDVQLKLPRFTLTELGGKHGATPKEIAKEILTKLTDQARKAIKKQGIDGEIDKLKAKVQEKIDAEKAKLKTKSEAEKAKIKQKIDDEKANFKMNNEAKIEAAKQKAKDKLKNLFNK